MLSFYSRILVAYDGSELGKKALQMAKALAKQDERIEVDVLHVVHTKYVPQDMVDEKISDKQKEKLMAVCDEARGIMKDLNNPIDYVVLKGHPAEMIIEYAKNRDVDLIVLGSRGLSPIKQVVMGSVSHSVLQHAPCNVLIAK